MSHLVSDAHAEYTRKKLMRMLSIRNSSCPYAQGTNQSLMQMLSIFKNFLDFKLQSRPPIETLCCKNHENPSDR